MSEYGVAVVGTGPDPKNQVSGESYAMGYRHAEGYVRLSNCELVACADLVRENAADFADTFTIPEAHVYESHHQMLTGSDPDIVSVCTPPKFHADITIDCARHPSVRAVHSEKPMADNWGDSRLMAQVCYREDVQLSFNHQLRLADRIQKAKQLLNEGTIGKLQRLELARKNLYDTGTHQIDICNYFNGDRSADWVLSGIEYSTEDIQFGVHNENQAIGLWAYENGVHCFAATGGPSDGAYRDVIGCENRLIGTEGVIEIEVLDGPTLRYKSDGMNEWETVDCDGLDPLHRTIEHIVTSLDEGTEPTVSARNALNTTEIIFACWESARQRGRIDLPLTIDDNPLESMVENGELLSTSAANQNVTDRQ